MKIRSDGDRQRDREAILDAIEKAHDGAAGVAIAQALIELCRTIDEASQRMARAAVGRDPERPSGVG